MDSSWLSDVTFSLCPSIDTWCISWKSLTASVHPWHSTKQGEAKCTGTLSKSLQDEQGPFAALLTCSPQKTCIQVYIMHLVEVGRLSLETPMKRPVIDNLPVNSILDYSHLQKQSFLSTICVCLCWNLNSWGSPDVKRAYSMLSTIGKE